MARQEDLFVETIMSMKRALRRNDDDSESDESINRASNRGNKLKRKAKYVEEGRLDLANGVRAYHKKINYNGYVREVISKNSSRLDLDGDVVDDAEDDSNEDLEDAHEDPYREIKIEDLLKPLTSAAELKTHPTLSLPYTSKALDEIIQSAQDMIQREQKALWRIKQLFNGFRGDSSWMPVGVFETSNDFALLAPETATASTPSSIGQGVEGISVASANGDVISSIGLAPDLESTTEAKDYAEHDHHIETAGMERVDNSKQGSRLGSTSTARKLHGSAQNNGFTSDTNKPETNGQGFVSTEGVEGSDANGSLVNGGQRAEIGDQALEQPPVHATEAPLEQEGANTGDASEDDEAMEDDAQPAHRMTTRAKAQAANSPTNSRESSPDSASDIHPFYLAPPGSLPGNDMGLPFEEADETRRLVSAYVQKQEDVVRSAWKMYNGLLKAKRLRDNVLEWCTAEGHIGELEDGEDWFDFEKWGVKEDELLKGKEEEEEEIAVVGKKTRNRRAAAV